MFIYYEVDKTQLIQQHIKQNKNNLVLSCLDEELADLLMEYHANSRWWCVTACDMRQGASLSN